MKFDISKKRKSKFNFLSTQPKINTSIYPTIKISVFAAPKTQKIRGPRFMSKSSETPLFQSFFTLLLMCFSQQNHALNMARYVHFDVIALRRSLKQIQPISSENIENCLVRFKSISSREHIHYFRKPA